MKHHLIIIQSYHNRQLLEDNISLTKVLWSSEHPVNKLIIQLISSSKKKSTLPLGQIQKYKNTNTNTMDKGDNLKPANSLHVVHCEWEALSCINVSETYVGLTIYKIKEILALPVKYMFGWYGIKEFLVLPLIIHGEQSDQEIQKGRKAKKQFTFASGGVEP